MTKWMIRPYRSEEEPGILNLLRIAHSRDLSPEWFQWRYKNSPFGDPILLVAESFSGEIVGFRASWHWPLAFHDKVISAYQTGDLCVRGDYRCQGIMLSLGKQGIEEARKRGAWMMFSFPNANSLPGTLKLGYRVVDHLPAWGRILRPIQSFFNFLMTLKDGKDNRQTPIDVNGKYFFSAQPHVDRITELQKQRNSSRLRSIRSKEFYTWRFSHSQRLFHIFSLDGKTPLMLLRPQMQRIGRTIFLLEQYISTDSPDWKIAMKAMRSQERINAIHTITNRALDGENSNFLKDSLSRVMYSPTTLTVKILQREAEMFLSKNMWNLNPLDMDFY